jgi:hypothetical protein
MTTTEFMIKPFQGSLQSPCSSADLRRSPSRKPDSAVGSVPVERQENGGLSVSQNCLILVFSPKRVQSRFLGALVPVDSGTLKDDGIRLSHPVTEAA